MDSYLAKIYTQKNVWRQIFGKQNLYRKMIELQCLKSIKKVMILKYV